MFLMTRSKDEHFGTVARSSESLGATLYEKCSRKVEELIHYACRNIQSLYGNYDEDKCRQKVEELQKYILANLPAMVFDELCEIRERRAGHQTQDIRIEMALYMHRNLRKFFIKNFIQMPASSLDCEFWAVQLSRLQNLVVLDLNLSCTDEILEIVAENCQKLAYIDIVSRVEQSQPGCFNALKLKYCVSDVGLAHLCKCKLLRKIRMNRKCRSKYGGGSVTLSGIRRLVKSLPLLQQITFEDMGMVLAEEMEDVGHLSLTRLSDFHPQPAHLAAISRLCPDLRQLFLRLSNANGTLQQANVLHALAESSLKVCELQLSGFLFSDQLANVMETKGCYLSTLAIENLGCITPAIVELIGRACPNLVNLHLSEEQCPGGVFYWTNFQYTDAHSSGGAFRNLQYLGLTGKTWIPKRILPLCLTSPKELKVLKIQNMGKEGCLDAIMARILSTNSLQELRAVYLCTRLRLTIGTIMYFIRNCPGLMELLFLRTDYITQEHMGQLLAEMEKQNFNLTGR